MGYVYIFFTILLTVYGQLIIKWQVLKVGAMPSSTPEKIIFFVALLLNPWVISAFFAAFLASLSWMGAMTKFPLSHAYPFMSLSFIFVFIFAALFFQEAVTLQKVMGLSLVVLGLIISSRG